MMIFLISSQILFTKQTCTNRNSLFAGTSLFDFADVLHPVFEEIVDCKQLFWSSVFFSFCKIIKG